MDTQRQPDPTEEPTPQANRMAWMAWENLWKKAASTKDEKLLATLIKTGLDTPKKQDAAGLVFEEWSLHPTVFEPKLMRLLLRNGAIIPDHFVAPLCACGDKAIELMQKHKVDLRQPNFLGENGLALACFITNETKFKKAWRLLRLAGLDPLAPDQVLENAMDAAEQFGKTDWVEHVEQDLLAEKQAQALHSTTPTTKRHQGRKRL